MVTKSLWSRTQGRFEELTRQECLRLFELKSVGRVAFCGPRGPRIFPVNYTLRHGSVIFRTAAYNTLAAGLRSERAAFEVDEIDDFHQSGWSVLAVGSARAVDDPEELTALWGDQGPEPWAPGTRALFVRITPDEVTGRRIHPN